MKIIFQIDGGLGKCIAATAVCKAVKTQYPDSKLIAISGRIIFKWDNGNASDVRITDYH